MQTTPQILPLLLSTWRFFLWLQEPCLLRVPQPCEPAVVHIALSPLSCDSLPSVCDYQVVGHAQEFISWEVGGSDQRKEGLLGQTPTGSHSSRTGSDGRDAQGRLKDDHCQGGHKLGSGIRKSRQRGWHMEPVWMEGRLQDNVLKQRPAGPRAYSDHVTGRNGNLLCPEASASHPTPQVTWWSCQPGANRNFQPNNIGFPSKEAMRKTTQMESSNFSLIINYKLLVVSKPTAFHPVTALLGLHAWEIILN